MECNSQNCNDTQVSITLDSRTQSPMRSTSKRLYEGITNFFGRFDPRAQLFENIENINPFARTNIVTLGPCVIIENTARVMTPPSEMDVRSQNLHATKGPTFWFDLELGPSKPQGDYHPYQEMKQPNGVTPRFWPPLRPRPPFQSGAQIPWPWHIKGQHICLIE